MKICFLSQEFPPETRRGGIGTYTYTISKELAKNHEVHVITETSGKERDYKENNVYIHKIKPKILRIPFFNIFFGDLIHKLCYNRQVYKKFNSLNINFNAIQASEWGFEALFLALNKKNNIITRLATPTAIVEKINYNKVSLQNKLINILEKIQAKKSKVIIAPTSFIGKKISKEWKIPFKRMILMPNPAPEIKKSNKKVPYKNFILFFGRLEKKKGVLVLLKALENVFKLYPNLKMIFIGKDCINFKNKVNKTLFKDNIILLPSLEQKHLFDIVSKARFVILPSLFENFAFSCLESMKLGKVVIATRNNGFEEIIQDNVSGFLVEPDNPKKLQEKILECLEKKDLDQIEKNAKKRANEFETKIIIKQLEKVYKNACLKQAKKFDTRVFIEKIKKEIKNA
jgi:glycosyltransferase involved in cell wall biosynthesis